MMPTLTCAAILPPPRKNHLPRPQTNLSILDRSAALPNEIEHYSETLLVKADLLGKHYNWPTRSSDGLSVSAPGSYLAGQT